MHTDQEFNHSRAVFRQFSRDNEYITQELNRLRFVIGRDGIDAAIAFAKQTLHTYKTHLKRRSKSGHRMGYGLAFRRPLVASCVVFRRFLRDNGHIN